MRTQFVMKAKQPLVIAETSGKLEDYLNLKIQKARKSKGQTINASSQYLTSAGWRMTTR